MNEQKQKTEDQDLARQILERLEESRIKMRPRWQFAAEKAGLESVLLLLLFAAALAASLLMHYWQTNELDRLAGFGVPGWFHIVLNFPYELLAAVLLSLLLINYAVKQLDWGYRRSWLVWTGSALALAVVFASALVALDLHKKVEAAAENLPVLHPFYQGRLHNIEQGVVPVRIIGLDQERVVLIDLRAATSADLVYPRRQLRLKPDSVILHIGEEARLYGRQRAGHFIGWGLEVAKP